MLRKIIFKNCIISWDYICYESGIYFFPYHWLFLKIFTNKWIFMIIYSKTNLTWTRGNFIEIYFLNISQKYHIIKSLIRYNVSRLHPSEFCIDISKILQLNTNIIPWNIYRLFGSYCYITLCHFKIFTLIYHFSYDYVFIQKLFYLWCFWANRRINNCLAHDLTAFWEVAINTPSVEANKCYFFAMTCLLTMRLSYVLKFVTFLSVSLIRFYWFISSFVH